MTTAASIAVLVAAMLAPDRIQAKLRAIQAQLSSNPDPPPPYIRYDDQTIIAGFRWQDELGPNGIVVAYHVTGDGALHRLSTYKYGDSPRSLETVHVVAGHAAEILVRGTMSPLEILGFDGKYLEELGETSTDARFIDIDADGASEIVEPSCCAANECNSPLRTPVVRRCKDGELVDVDIPGLQDVISLTKTGDDPETFEEDVALENEASTTCVLRVVNGRRRATAIEIDGKAVSTPDQEVTFPSRCAKLQVTLTGPAGAHVVILVLSSRA